MDIKEVKESIVSLVKNIVSDEFGVDASVRVEVPANKKLNDFYTNVAFAVAKDVGASPESVAKKIVDGINKKGGDVSAEFGAPGFVNMFLSEDLKKKLLKYFGEDFSYSRGDFSGQRWLIEHTSPNPNKAMHLGHLKNNLTGMAFANLCEVFGVEVIRDMVNNNRGIAIAKLMWGYLKFALKEEFVGGDVELTPEFWMKNKEKWYLPKDLGVRPDRFVDDLYVKASADFENDESVADYVRSMVVKWESGDEAVRELWKLVMDISLEGQEMTLKRLGNKWDWRWNEHEYYEMGKDLVKEGVEKGIFKVLDDGAVLSDLEAYGLPDTILIKKDGTSLYITQDLALTKLKKEKFSPDKMFWVIGKEQSVAMKQVFAICEQLGLGKADEFTHLGYGYITVRRGDGGSEKMSSRKGNVLYIDDLIDLVKEKVAEAGNLEDGEIAEKLALGAVKFSILKPAREIDMVFDVDKSVSVTGDSFVYVNYAYARIMSLKKRVEESGSDFVDSGLPSDDVLVRTLMAFDDVMQKSMDEYSVHNIVNYSLALARAFNAFYEKNPIMGDDGVDLWRYLLVSGVANVLERGLGVLGIGLVESM